MSFFWDNYQRQTELSLNKFTQPLKASGLTLNISEITPAQKIKAPGQFLKRPFSGAFPEHNNTQGHFLDEWPPA